MFHTAYHASKTETIFLLPRPVAFEQVVLINAKGYKGQTSPGQIPNSPRDGFVVRFLGDFPPLVIWFLGNAKQHSLLLLKLFHAKCTLA
jgi:hypothetical protein